MKVNVEVKQEFKVTFADPDAAYNFFIADDTPGSWRNTFWRYDTLEELAQGLSRMISAHSGWWSDMKLEGFGHFKRNEAGNWVTVKGSSIDCGQITVWEGEVETE